MYKQDPILDQDQIDSLINHGPILSEAELKALASGIEEPRTAANKDLLIREMQQSIDGLQEQLNQFQDQVEKQIRSLHLRIEWLHEHVGNRKPH